jgi:hypothetical protein
MLFAPSDGAFIMSMRWTNECCRMRDDVVHGGQRLTPHMALTQACFVIFFAAPVFVYGSTWHGQTFRGSLLSSLAKLSKICTARTNHLGRL